MHERWLKTCSDLIPNPNPNPSLSPNRKPDPNPHLKVTDYSELVLKGKDTKAAIYSPSFTPQSPKKSPRKKKITGTQELLCEAEEDSLSLTLNLNLNLNLSLTLNLNLNLNLNLTLTPI